MPLGGNCCCNCQMDETIDCTTYGGGSTVAQYGCSGDDLDTSPATAAFTGSGSFNCSRLVGTGIFCLPSGGTVGYDFSAEILDWCTNFAVGDANGLTIVITSICPEPNVGDGFVAAVPATDTAFCDCPSPPNSSTPLSLSGSVKLAPGIYKITFGGANTGWGCLNGVGPLISVCRLTTYTLTLTGIPNGFGVHCCTG